MKRRDESDAVTAAREAANRIARSTSLRPALGLILGSGWATAIGSMAESIDLDYADIPNFPKPRVMGHPGHLLVGLVSGKPVVALCGRPHLYEGHASSQIGFPVRVLKELGVKSLIVTNAAGGLNPSFLPGDLMAITDHINLPGLIGESPMVGIDGAFLDMNHAYDPQLIEVAMAACSSVGERLRQGVYAMVGGPTYETPAESSMLRALGADAVGMSTAPEVIVARWVGIKVLGLSLITNMAIQVQVAITHEQVLRGVEEAIPRLRALVEALVRIWPE